MKRIIIIGALLTATAFAGGCGKKCPPDKACMYLMVMGLAIPPDHKKCETGLKIRGERATDAKSLPGAKSISLGPPLVPIWSRGTMPPSCIHDLYLRDLAPGKWKLEFTFGENKKSVCEVELVSGPKFNFITHIKEHRQCSVGVGPARESDL